MIVNIPPGNTEIKGPCTEMIFPLAIAWIGKQK